MDNSLWSRVISSIHGDNISYADAFHPSLWNSIIKEVAAIKDQGVDLISHCRIRVGDGLRTKFWMDTWIGDTPLHTNFPRIFALDSDKDGVVATKLNGSLCDSFRRTVRGGVEEFQFSQLNLLMDSVTLSPSEDRWIWDINGDGDFCVKEARRLLDDFFLPKSEIPTRWVKLVPVKINVFAWRVWLDRLPTRMNLIRRNVQVASSLCPVCLHDHEDISHLMFRCCLASDLFRSLCRWWDLSWSSISSYSDWLEWFKNIRLNSKSKGLLEGVFYIYWWSVWNFRNQLLFSDKIPRKDVLFDDIVSRSFTWCHSRCNKSFSGSSWLQHPNLISL